MIPYMNALDLSQESKERKKLINDVIVNKILNRREGEHGTEILVSFNIDTVGEFQALHPEMPLFPPFDRHCQPSASERDTIVIIAQRHGRMIGCLGARLKYVRRIDEDLRSMKFLYEDYRTQAPYGEVCMVPSGAGSQIKFVSVALGGSGWVEGTERGHHLYSDMAKLLFILEHTRPGWDWTYQAALLSEKNMSRFACHPSGMRDFVGPIIYKLLPGQSVDERIYFLASRHREQADADTIRAEIADEETRINFPTSDEIDAQRARLWSSPPRLRIAQ